MYYYCRPLFVSKILTTILLLNTFPHSVSTHIHSCPLCHATMAGKVQLSEKETRWEGEEGKSLTVNVNREDNMRCTSCPHPCNWGDHCAHNQWEGGREGGNIYILPTSSKKILCPCVIKCLPLSPDLKEYFINTFKVTWSHRTTVFPVGLNSKIRLRQRSLRWPFISQRNTVKCQQKIRQCLHFNCKHLVNPYINCDCSDFWCGTDGSSRSLPKMQYCECQKKQTSFTMFARWVVTEWGTTTFLLFPLLGNEVTLFQRLCWLLFYWIAFLL